MMDKIAAWLRKRISANNQTQSAHTGKIGTNAASRPKKTVRPVPAMNLPNKKAGASVRIEGAGPGKNRLVRSKFLREETGTHDTLKIIDDSLIDSDEESGIDPYNTGAFDRSKNWRNRYRN